MLYTPLSLSAAEAYIISHAKGDIESLDKFILEAVAQRLESLLEIQFKYRSATFSRNLLLMQQGINDIMAFLTKQQEREDYLHYIEPPLSKLNIKFIVRKGEHATIQRYDDLYSLKIGALRGAKISAHFIEDKKLNKSDIISIKQGISKLLLYRLDTVPTPEPVASYQIWKLGLQHKLELADYVYHNPKYLYIALSKKAPIMKRLNDVEPIIQNMIESGEIRNIIEKFFTQRNLAVPDIW